MISIVSYPSILYAMLIEIRIVNKVYSVMPLIKLIEGGDKSRPKGAKLLSFFIPKYAIFVV